MIQNIVKIKSTTTLPTKDKKKTYLSVVWTDGAKEYKKPIFDPALQKVFQEAEKSGESVNVGVEKEGDFWNVKTAEITTEAPKTEQKPRTEGTKQPYGKSPDERASIERQVALKVTSEIYCHCTEAGILFDEPMFRKMCKVCKNELGLDSPLVAAIKKEGGVEE